MKRFLIPPLIFLLVLIFLGVGVFYWWGENSKPVSEAGEKARFVIPKGYSASQIGSKLFKSGLIRSPLAFKVYVQVTDKTRELKPGEFNLYSNMGLVDIVGKLLEGPDELWVTIPEGLRREEITKKFIEGLELDGGQAGTFRMEFLAASEGKEGFLFPDTYLFPRDVDASVVVGKMSKTFDEKIEAIRGAIDESDNSLEQFVTMASIIEREAKTDEERPIVAGILWKRLETDGWLLQADASVQYAVADVKCSAFADASAGRQMSPASPSEAGRANVECTNWWPQLTRDDLEIDSLYNSYKYGVLPPTPIANPGLSSIKGAVFPEDTSYWFYLHDSDGNIHYAKTIEEHNENVRVYLGK